MDLLRVRRLFVGERVARFGMSGPGGRPRITPVPFAAIDDGAEGVIVCTLDTEPRSIGAAATVRALSSAPRVTLLADSGPDAVCRWWARADGVAEVLRSGPDPRFAAAVAALAARYGAASAGGVRTVVWTTVTCWNGWIGAREFEADAA